MAKTNIPFSLESYLMDDGTQIDASTQSGLGMANAGIEQIRQRRALEEARRFHLNYHQPGFGPGRFRNTLSSPGDDALFGLLQMKENAADASGLGFKVLFPFNAIGAFGSDVSTAVDPDQLALSGLRRASSRKK